MYKTAVLFISLFISLHVKNSKYQKCDIPISAAWHSLSVNVLLSNIAFLIFAVFGV